ncbi:MAG: PSD1 and planctomycete cytochrome C domain-containing protein [Bryobacteraceae bacterium]
MKSIDRPITLIWSLLLAGGTVLAAQDKAGIIDFARDIQPVLRARCVMCHGPQQQVNGLRLDRRDDAMRGGYSGAVIKPGDSAASKLFQLVSSGIESDGKRVVMPPGAHLPPKDADLFRRWIDQGAVWPKEAGAHVETSRPVPWSFAPIRRPGVPAVSQAAWVRTPIDSFVLSKLEGLRITPSEEAAKTTLVRRLYLDLIGLPPNPAEVQAFLADERPGAYERLVDRLLQSSHYGEKWARPWLDLARYADSEGGIQDYVRPYAWRYRQWVIEGLNQDMPFDRFTIEQMGGDLLPGSTMEQKLATGFHRNSITSREGGIDLDELRYAQLIDRTNTVGTAWLGLTVGCAQCHDHKYDPISQKDYYRLLAFFQNSLEVDLDAPLPGERGPYRQYIGKYRKERQKLLDEYGVAALQAPWEDRMRFAYANPGKRTDYDAAYDQFTKQVDNAVKILLKPVEKRNYRESEAITNYFLKDSRGVDTPKLKPLGEKLIALSEKYPAMSVILTLAEDTKREPTNLRLRGNFRDLGIEVTPGTLEALPKMPSQTADRLALGRWLVSRDNPLTARVAVNRMWQELFGRGLVNTSEDFGMQGDKPSHPELLDWLASEFIESGWSRKALCRLIVTSSVYRQKSELRTDLTARDPANVLLARQSRLRLPAELIRDSALQASGLLLDTVGGESVRPPQPEGVTDLVYNFKWVESSGRDRYRRGIYVQTQRTALYPLLMNFDVPDRTVTCSRREVSNTPLQALNLMNDSVFTEAAQALAARVLKEASGTKERLNHAFQVCFARNPRAGERDSVLSYLERRRQMARTNPKAADQMPVADVVGVDQAEAVAWFGLSRALINADEFLTRE